MNEIKKILHKLIGNDNILSNNILFIDFTGSHEKAQFLSQIFYWSSRTKRADGYFAKRYDEWFTEVRVKGHSVRRYTKEFIKKGFLETKVKKFDGVPTVHYKLDQEKLISALLTFCDSNNLSQSHKVTIECDTESESMNVTQSNNPLTEITTETTTEIKEKAETPVSPTTKKEKQVDHFTAPQFDGLKKKIGPKHYRLLNEIHETPGMKEKLIKLWKDKTFNILMDFLEHRKEIKRPYPSKSAIITLINTDFHDYPKEELEATLKKAIKGSHQGFFPDEKKKINNTHKEPRDARIIDNMIKQISQDEAYERQGGFKLGKIAS